MRLPKPSLVLPVLACLAAAPLAAQVKLIVAPPSIQPGETTALWAELEAPLPDAAGPVEWDWTLESTAASRWELPEPLGTLAQEPGGVCRYTAPEDAFPLGRRTVRVRAAVRGREDLGAAREITISTSFAETLFNHIPHICEYLAVSSLRQPRVGLLAGDPSQQLKIYARGSAQFMRPVRVAWAGDHPTMPGTWLVLDREFGEKVKTLDDQGEVRPWLELSKSPRADRPGGPTRRITGMAVRRPGPGAGSWRAVLVDGFQDSILEVDGKGEVSLLAGMPYARGHQDGAARQSRFHQPADAVIGADGSVYVTDKANRAIRRIKDGQVTTLAHMPDTGFDQVGDGTWDTRLGPEAIAQDPRRGDLYVVDGLSFIHRVSLAGEVTTLVGRPGGRRGRGMLQFWPETSLPASGLDGVTGIPYLDLAVGLTVHGDKLFIADDGKRALLVLDLVSGRLSILAGGASVPRPPAGPGSFRAGALEGPGQVAAVGYPNHMAFNPEGRCLLATNTISGEVHGACIAELSLAGVAAETGAAEPESSAAEPEPKPRSWWCFW
jgi:hypothetical protein